MNISDLPQDLFDYHIFNELYPHCNLINKYVKFTNINIDDIEYVIDNDIRIEITKQICYYNNKHLLIYYKYCSYLELSKILYYTVCPNCILFNYFDTFKWAIVNTQYYCKQDDYPHYFTVHLQHHNYILLRDIYVDIIIKNRLYMLKWFYFNEHFDVPSYTTENALYHIIGYNRVSIFKWAIAHNFPIDVTLLDMNNKEYNGTIIHKTIFRLLQQKLKN